MVRLDLLGRRLGERAGGRGDEGDDRGERAAPWDGQAEAAVEEKEREAEAT